MVSMKLASLALVVVVFALAVDVAQANYYYTNTSCIAGAMFPLPIQAIDGKTAALANRGRMKMKVYKTSNGGIVEFVLDMPLTTPLPIAGILSTPQISVAGDIKCPGATTTSLKFNAFLTNPKNTQRWLHSFGTYSLNAADFTQYEACWRVGYGKLSVTYSCLGTSDCNLAIGYAMMHTARGCLIKRFY